MAGARRWIEAVEGEVERTRARADFVQKVLVAIEKTGVEIRDVQNVGSDRVPHAGLQIRLVYPDELMEGSGLLVTAPPAGPVL